MSLRYHENYGVIKLNPIKDYFVLKMEKLNHNYLRK